MNISVANSLHVIEGILGKAGENQAMKFKTDELIAKELIGLPYYWGEYSGLIEPTEKEPRKVIAHIKSNLTGEECHWKFDSLRVVEHLKTIQAYSSWEEYNLAQKMAFAEDYENVLIKYDYSNKDREEKMREYCIKFSIPYKHYLEQ
jgi:hypothetical protein